jgi:hypothetical protein
MDSGIISQKAGTALYAGQDWQLVERKTVTGSAITSHTFSSLTGDSETEYRLVAYIKSNYAAGNCDYYLTIHADTGNNYGRQRLLGTNNVASADRTAGHGTGFLLGTDVPNNNILFADTIISSKSGVIRPAIIKTAYPITSTTVTNLGLTGSIWNNTANEITSMQVLALQTGGLGIGTDLFLFARRLGGTEATSGMRFGTLNAKGTMSVGCFQLKERYEVSGSAATSKTFTGLTGNTNPLYLVVAMVVHGANNNQLAIRPNNDTSTNYGYQNLTGNNVTVAASRATGSYFRMNDIGNSSADKSMGTCLIYAKSGNERVALIEESCSITTTTVTQISLVGQSWSNTADEITSLVALATQTNGLGVGTVIELYQLNLGV